MRDSQHVDDMQSPPTELGLTNGRSSRVTDDHDSRLKLDLQAVGAQVITNQSQTMFDHHGAHSSRNIEIAVAV